MSIPVTLPFDYPETIETAFIHLKGAYLEVKKGYCWDGASGPTIDTTSTMRGFR